MTPVDPKLAQNLRPARLVDLARSYSRSDFSLEIEHPLLLVPAGDPTSELALALDESANLDGARIEPTTSSHTAVGALTTQRGAQFAAWEARAPFNARVLRSRLARALYFALPLHKRPDASRSGSSRITVGRTRNNDIFLGNATVSKFHAWFERDDNDVFYVADAASSNGTRLNGIAIGRHAPTAIASGDDLRFGAVTTTVCLPEVLWDALFDDGGGPRPPPNPPDAGPASSRS
jgi:FHA domain